VIVVVVALVLGGLAYDCADAGTGGSADDGAFEAAAEDCAQDRAAGCSDGGSLAGAYATLIAAVVVMVGAVVVVVVAVAAVASLAHAVVVGAVVVLGWKHAGRQQEGSEKDRRSKLGHFRLDADFRRWGTPLPPCGVFWGEAFYFQRFAAGVWL
jgi:hypothetical protein